MYVKLRVKSDSSDLIGGAPGLYLDFSGGSYISLRSLGWRRGPMVSGGIGCGGVWCVCGHGGVFGAVCSDGRIGGSSSHVE